MDLVVRAVVGFVFVLFLTRIVGRRELSTLQPFDLILLVMIGDLVQQGITQNDFSVTGMVLVGGTIGVLTVPTSWTSFRFPRLRPMLEGEPLIVVEDGKPIDRNLARNRVTTRSWPLPPAGRASGRSTTSAGPCWRRAARSASSPSDALPHRSGRGVAARARGRARGGRGCFRRMAAGAVDNRPRESRAARRRGPRRHVRRRPRARLRGPEDLRRLRLRGRPLRRLALRVRAGRARRRAGGEPARPAPHRRRERRGGEVPRPPGCGDARGDRLRLAGREPGRGHSRRRADDRAGRRLLPDAREPRRVLRARRGRAGREPSRRGRAGRRRHGHDLEGPGPPRRVAAAGRARLRGRCQRPEVARARQRRARAGCLRLLRLARAVEAGVRRPDRARRAGRARLARGARAPGGRRRRGEGRASDEDVVVFKSNGLAAWDVAIGAAASGGRANAVSVSSSRSAERGQLARPRSCRRRSRGSPRAGRADARAAAAWCGSAGNGR